MSEVPLYTAGHDILSQVNWLILGSKLPGRVLPEHPIDLRLCLSWVIDLGEMFWLAVGHLSRRWQKTTMLSTFGRCCQLLTTVNFWQDEGDGLTWVERAKALAVEEATRLKCAVITLSFLQYIYIYIYVYIYIYICI